MFNAIETFFSLFKIVFFLNRIKLFQLILSKHIQPEAGNQYAELQMKRQIKTFQNFKLPKHCPITKC